MFCGKISFEELACTTLRNRRLCEVCTAPKLPWLQHARFSSPISECLMRNRHTLYTKRAEAGLLSDNPCMVHGRSFSWLEQEGWQEGGASAALFHCDCTSSSARCHSDFASMSLRGHFDGPLRTSCPLQVHSKFSACPLWCHFDLTLI